MKICISADWHINKDNRLEDTERTIDELVQKVVTISPHYFVFNGDAYKNWRPTPLEMNIFHNAILKIASKGIEVTIVVGNHDYPESEEYRGVHCFTELTTRLIALEKYTIRVVDTPFLFEEFTPEYTGVFMPHIPKNRRKGTYAEEYAGWLNSHVTETKKKIIVFSHVFLSEAKIGAGDKEVVSSSQVPADVLRKAGVGFAFLGDIHKAQRIEPNYFYSGSIERIDFGEREDIKGFIEFNTSDDSVKFHGLEARKLEQVIIDLINPGFFKQGSLYPNDEIDRSRKVMDDAGIEGYIINLLNTKKEDLCDALVKIKFICTRSQKNTLNELERKIVAHLLDKINAYRIKGIAYEIVDSVAVRNAEINESLNPVKALRIWVGMQNYKGDWAQHVLLAGENILRGHQ